MGNGEQHAVILAIEAIQGLGWPLAPSLARAFASENELTKRRAIHAVDLLGRDGVQEIIRQRASQPQLFEVPPGLKAALLPLLRDPSSVVRFDALNTYLAVPGGGVSAALQVVAADRNRSVQEIAIRARSNEYDRSWRDDGWFTLRALAIAGLAHPEYGKTSEWVPWRDDLQLRVSVSNSELMLSEPAYYLNAPVWIRAELRNGGPGAAEVTTDAEGIPLLRLEVRDESGFSQQASPFPMVSHFTTKTTELAAGDAIVWEFHLFLYCRFWGNGTFTIHGDGGAPLVSLDVRGIPVPPWRQYPRLGQSPGIVAYPRQELFAHPRNSPATASELPRPEADLEIPEQLHRFVQLGDRAALASLTHRLRIDAITELLHAMKPHVPKVENARGSAVATGSIQKDGWFTQPRLFIDPAGDRHLTFVRYFRAGKDVASEVYYARGDGVGWSRPVVILGDGRYLGNPQLAMDGEGTLYLFAAAHSREPPAGDQHLEYDVMVRRRSPGRDWGPAEGCLPRKPRLLLGFDAAADSAGNIHLVWAPWFGKDHRTRIHHRMAMSGGWQPEQVLPGVDRDLSNPRIRFLDGHGIVFGTGRPPDDSTGKFGMFWFQLTDAGWSGPQLVKDELVGFCGPTSGAPHLVQLADRLEASSFSTALFRHTASGMTRVDSSFWLPDIKNYIDGVAMTAGPDGSAYGLANWNGIPVLFRTADSTSTEAMVLSDLRSWETSDESTRRSWTMGLPDLAIRENEWHGLWVVNDHDNSSLYYGHGLLSTNGWVEAQRLSFLLRPLVGLLPSDLAFIRSEVLAEARAAQRQGHAHDALDRYIYLVSNSPALVRHGQGAPGQELTEALETLKNLYGAEDGRARQYLWALLREEPENIAYGRTGLYQLLMQEVRPRVRVERSQGNWRFGSGAARTPPRSP